MSEKQLIAFFLFFWLVGCVQTAYEFKLTDSPSSERERESVRGQQRMRQSIWEIEMCWKFDTHTILLFTFVLRNFPLWLYCGNRKKQRHLTHAHPNKRTFHNPSSISSDVCRYWVVHHNRQITSYLLLLFTCCSINMIFYLQKKQFYFQSDQRTQKNGRFRCRW